MQVSLRKTGTKPIHWAIKPSAVIGVVVPSIRENLAANLRRLLREKNLKQRDFGRAIGVTEQVVSQWVNGRACPEYRQLDRIAEVLAVPYQELVKNPDDDVPIAQLPIRDIDAILDELARIRGFRLIKKNKD